MSIFQDIKNLLTGKDTKEAIQEAGIELERTFNPDRTNNEAEKKYAQNRLLTLSVIYNPGGEQYVTAKTNEKAYSF